MSETDEGLSIVYVEDDERLARLTTQYLRSRGVTVVWLARGDRAVHEVLRIKPDVVLLDVMLPGLSGLEICRQLRQSVSVPIVFVSARTDEADLVLGLESGADDYIAKPFSARELLARLRARARRACGQVGVLGRRFDLGALTIDADSRTAKLWGETLVLTTHEFNLLRVLAEHAGEVLGREQLLQLVHQSPDDAFDRSIDVHVSRLRHKLETDPRRPRFLKTVRGVGYVLVADAS